MTPPPGGAREARPCRPSRNDKFQTNRRAHDSRSSTHSGLPGDCAQRREDHFRYFGRFRRSHTVQGHLHWLAACADEHVHSGWHQSSRRHWAALEPPPHPSCVPVFIASDSEGYFGHECPNCGKYWRSGTLVRVCPYCRGHGEAFQFLTPAHLAYVRHYARTLFNGVKATQPGQSNQVSMARLFLNHNFIIPAQANRRDSSVSAVRWITISGADMDFAHAADGETTSQTFKRRSTSFERT